MHVKAQSPLADVVDDFLLMEAFHWWLENTTGLCQDHDSSGTGCQVWGALGGL